MIQRALLLQSKRALSAGKGAFQAGMEEFAALEASLAASKGGKTSKKSWVPSGDASLAADSLRSMKARVPGGPVKSKPIEPHENACCGNGCHECVWVVYWRELQEWEESKLSES
ncbi:unnamed protein product [Chrysoparadoxa australica]